MKKVKAKANAKSRASSKVIEENPNHEKEIGRLNRVIGQAEGLKKMIENERDSAEIIVLLRAIRSALKSIEANVLETYLESQAFGVLSANSKLRNQKIAELKEIFKRYE